MARKTERVTIDAEGRDNGKTFLLTEMDSVSALKWCARAILSLSQSGTNVPPGALKKAAESGPDALATLGLQIFALIPEAVALPLLEEARACVEFQPPDSRISAQPILAGDMCQVEEVGTWKTLLHRVFALHLGFSTAAAPPITE